MAVIHVTNDTFEQEVLQAKEPVLVDFWATWCGPCQMVAPVLEEIAEEMKDAKVCKIDVDEQPELAREYRVMSIPTLMVFKDGQAVKREVGAKPKNEILEMLKQRAQNFTEESKRRKKKKEAEGFAGESASPSASMCLTDCYTNFTAVP